MPIKAPVAGIAMGLVKEGEKIAILSDILGDEDHLGDMDFKVCGTKDGITSIQMDIKITGLTTEIMSRALEQARRGRLHILGEMLKAIDAPRKEISQLRAAHHHHHDPAGVHQERHRAGRQGDQGHHRPHRSLASTSRTRAGWTSPPTTPRRCSRRSPMIQALTREAEVGKIYLGTVRKIAEFGAFVELFPGTDGLIHISELSDKRVKSVSDVLKEGDEVMVKVISIDRTGKIRLSRKEALAERAGAAATPTPAAAPARPRRPRPSSGSGRGVLIAAAADPLAATRSLVAPLLDVPRGTPPRLASRVRRLASVSAASPAHDTPVGALAMGPVRVRRIRPQPRCRCPATRARARRGSTSAPTSRGSGRSRPWRAGQCPPGWRWPFPRASRGRSVRARGLALRHGITCINAPGTIDADYRGEVQVLLVNLSGEPYILRRGERIAQLVVAPVSHAVLEEVDALPTTARGDGGFGSTGR